MIIKPSKDAAELYIDETTTDEILKKSIQFKDKIDRDILEFIFSSGFEDLEKSLLAIDCCLNLLSAIMNKQVKKDGFLNALNPIILEKHSKEKAYELIMGGEKVARISKDEVPGEYYYEKDGEIYFYSPKEEYLVNWDEIPEGEFYIKKWRNENDK